MQQVYGFLGQGLLLQGHSSKGLMAEAGVGGQPGGERSRTWLPWSEHQQFHQYCPS